MVIKKFNRSELAKKIQVNRCICNMHVHRFWWVWSSRFRRYCYSQKQPNFPFDPWIIYSPWSSKNLIDRNWLKKFVQIGVDVTCMYTDFGGCGRSGFGDTATLKNDQISLSDHGLSMVIKKFNRSELAQKIRANRC